MLDSLSYFDSSMGLRLDLFAQFSVISSNIDEVLSINSSANVLVFGDFNVYRKGWFIRTYSIGTDRRGKLCYNLKSPYFSARIPDFDSHSPALLDLFFALAWYFFYNGILPVGKPWSCCCLSFHWLPFKLEKWISLFITQLLTILLLIRMVFVVNWEIFHGRISLNLVFLLLLLTFVSRSSLKLMLITPIVNIGSSSFIFMVFSCLRHCHSSSK